MGAAMQCGEATIYTLQRALSMILLAIMLEIIASANAFLRKIKSLNHPQKNIVRCGGERAPYV